MNVYVLGFYNCKWEYLCDDFKQLLTDITYSIAIYNSNKITNHTDCVIFRHNTIRLWAITVSKCTYLLNFLIFLLSLL